MSDRPSNRPRPIYATRQGQYDQPPATGAQRPWFRRRQSRLHRFYDNEPAVTASGEPVTRSPYGDVTTTTQPRRRQRSMSPESSSQQDSSFSSDRRRGYDEFRQHLTKRRKIEPDVLSRRILYGHHGQVEPGRLKMFLISCDGGQHTDPSSPHIDLGPGNVLKTDKSVYSSDRRSASIIIRHADDTPFTLTQLMVVAPEHGFDAPVKEGLIYVSMTLDALTKYTDKVEDALQHEPPPYTAEPESITDHAESPDELALYSPPPAQRSGYSTDHVETQQTSLGRARPNSYNTTSTDGDIEPEDSTSQEVIDFRVRRLQLSQRRRWRDRRLNRALPLVDDFSAFVDSTSQFGSSYDTESRRPSRIRPGDVLDPGLPSTTESGCQRVELSMLEKKLLKKDILQVTIRPYTSPASVSVQRATESRSISERLSVAGLFY
ncbi:hypothetical protein AMS68_004541 [Peltaster fructicola]|uniref:Uncharacterized protein n=1 Tax=Peltaster fructicola TaxID=286661 RepID=A0A6H0XWC4_9PEZI|nr:hypothetical protein AMS68_004541 [Peltaster fructicola]